MYNHTDLKNLVDKAIINIPYNTEAGNLIDPVKYILSIGGKRIRPVLALMACNLFSDKIDEAIVPSVGLEVFHNFTLVHDDIMDQALVRRNFPTVHNKWSINQAVLSGDVMAFIANECFLQTPSRCLLKVFRIFNKAAVEVCVGQQLDINFEKAKIISQQEYLRMIELKTAALIAASVKIGALIGGAEERDAEIIYDFGKNLGLAFQIQDDILDSYGNVEVFGKIRGGDILANKKTFLLVKAFDIAKKEELKQLQELYSHKNMDPHTKISKVIDLYDHLNIKGISEKLANSYINNAFSLLDKVKISKERKGDLIQITNSFIGRDK